MKLTPMIQRKGFFLIDYVGYFNGVVIDCVGCYYGVEIDCGG